MNNPRFYVFGVPDGFNLFQGDAEDTSYFQLFYDGSKENTKLAIHRKVNGQVSYSYLKYRLFSGEGRAGAFFGMSVVFNGEYCYDTPKLYRLFDSVYREIILKNKILLEEIKENTNAQAKFLIRAFKQQETEVRNIENIILRNIENAFASDIRSIDDLSFKPGKPNLIRKINANQDNNIILEALRNYSWVSISPEYPDEIIDQIDDDGIKKYKSNYDAITEFIMVNSLKPEINPYAVAKEIHQYESTITSTLNEIQKYLKNQPALKTLEEKYGKLKNHLLSLKSTVENKSAKTGAPRVEEGNIQNVETTAKEVISTETDAPLNSKNINHPKFKKRKYRIAAMTFIFIVTVGLLWKQPWKGTTLSDTKDCLPCIEYYQNFDQYLSKNKFDAAWNELKKLKEESKDIREKQTMLIEKVKAEADSLKQKNTIENLLKAKKLLKQSAGYGNADIAQDTLEITQKVIALQGNRMPGNTNAQVIPAPVTVTPVEAPLPLDTNKGKNAGKKGKDSVKQTVNDTAPLVIQILRCDINFKNPKATSKNEQYIVGDRLCIQAKQGNKIASDGKWKIEDNDNNIEVSGLFNPIQVKLLKAGNVKLIYKNQSCQINIRR